MGTGETHPTTRLWVAMRITESPRKPCLNKKIFAKQESNPIVHIWLKRALTLLLLQRLAAYPAVALLGARQCGKTTLARSLGG